jgi:RHS repeat-associated protein
MSLPAGDTDSDGDFDSTDAAAITGTYDVRKDVNLDGTVDVLDYLDALDINGGLSTQGWSILSNPKWNNRKGYAGYECDTVLAGTKWHVRHRVLESELGRWMRRDPLGYVDGAHLVSYVRTNPMSLSDPMGLAAVVSPCIGCGINGEPSPPAAILPAIPPLPPVYCETDTTSSECKAECDEYNALGFARNTDLQGYPERCCVCTKNIQSNPIYGFPPVLTPSDRTALDIIIHCVDHHERTHMEQDWNQSPWGSKSCRECQAYINEMACYDANAGRCTDAQCRERIYWAKKEAQVLAYGVYGTSGFCNACSSSTPMDPHYPGPLP